jgi:hypothetical protein
MSRIAEQMTRLSANVQSAPLAWEASELQLPSSDDRA